MHDYYYFINRLLLFTAVAFLVSSLDDLFIDVYYWLRRLYRFLFVRDRIKPLTIEQLRSKEEQAIAIMVPAWKEDDVIAQMLEANIRFLDYENYYFFVGAYQNDPATIREVDRMVALHPNVKKVVVPHDGPTNKADCLNWIIQAVFLAEKQTGIHFAMIAMHDSEDVIHPYELRMFNYLVPRKDLIQIPVRCLETKWYDFIRGSYIDEFSEFHTKDMVVRESLVGIVPSAGVSTCFSRKAIDILVADNEAQPFNISSLTEDYDISYRLSEHPDIKQIFVVFPVSVAVTDKLYHTDTGEIDEKTREERERRETIPIATAEYFPNSFTTAVRQKTRWNIGIFFQAAGRETWKGGLFHKYYFFHDRKGILVNLIMLPAYFLLANVLILWFGHNLNLLPIYYFDLPPWLVYANTFLLINRAFQRAYFTGYLYSFGQGLLSIPRIFYSNAINFCSTLRATYFYIRHLITGKAITWDKTTHEYPSLQVLETRYQRLGDMLVERNIVNETQLEDLLDEQKVVHIPLGRLALDKGLLDESQLLNLLSSQTGYTEGHPEDAVVEESIALLPPRFMLEHKVFAHCKTDTGGLEVFTSRALPPAVTEAIQNMGYSSVAPLLVLEKDLEPLLQQVERHEKGQRRLGDMLLDENRISPDRLDALLQANRRGEGSLGALLLSRKIVGKDELRSLLSRQAGYPAWDQTPVPAREEAEAMINPLIIRLHKIYPLKKANETLEFLTTREISEDLKQALSQAGYTDLKPVLALDEEVEPLVAEMVEAEKVRQGDA